MFLVKPKNNLLISQCRDLSWPVVLFFSLAMFQTMILSKASLLLIILILLLEHFREVIFILKGAIKAYGLIVILIWEILSITWSKVQITTIVYVVNDIEILTFCLLAAFHSRNKDVAKSLKVVCFAVISYSLAYCLVFPGDSMSSIGLKSFYLQKNTLGYCMAISALIILFTFKKSLSNYFFLFTSILFLLLSQSKTSLNLFLIVLAIVAVFFISKYFYTQFSEYTQEVIKIFFKVTPSILYVLIFIGVLYREDVAILLMNSITDDAFTGRGLLWNTVLTRTFDQLLIGNGPGVFWGSELMSEIAQTSLYQQPWVKDLHAADGGYIDVIGSLGFVGLALVFIAIIQFYKLAFSAPKIKIVYLSVALTTFFILHNLTESGFFRFVSLLWFLFEFFTFYLIFISENDQSYNSRLGKSFDINPSQHS